MRVYLGDGSGPGACTTRLRERDQIAASMLVGSKRSIMLNLYLDQFVWIQLAQAANRRRGATAAASDALAMLRYGVEHGLVSCPLSFAHYIETHKRVDAGSRHRLATVMAELSRFNTIAPPAAVLRAELDNAVTMRFPSSALPQPLRLLGSGAGFALDRPQLGKYELPKAPNATRRQRSESEIIGRHLMEMALLMGPSEGALPGVVENRGYRSFGESYVVGEQRLAGGIADHKARDDLEDWIMASVLVDILEPLNEAFERAGISREASPEINSKEGLTALMLDLPSRRVVYELRRGRHGNPQTKWEGNDLDDLEALAVAIPYCDAVITEKQWVHFGTRSGLDTLYDTRLLSSLRDLPAVLAAVA